MRVRLLDKPKPNNYTESFAVNKADIWRERTCEYPGYRQLMIKALLSFGESGAGYLHLPISWLHSSYLRKEWMSWILLPPESWHWNQFQDILPLSG